MVIEAMDEANYWDEINSSIGPDEEPYLRLPVDSDDLDEWAELVEGLRTEHGYQNFVRMGAW